MLRKVAFCTAIAALSLLCLVPRYAVSQVPYVQYRQTFTSAVAGSWHIINGQGSCTAVTSGTYTGLTAEIDGSADNGTTSGGAIITGISSNGTTAGSLSSAGFTAVRINVTAITTGSATFLVTCGNISGSASLSGTIPVAIVSPNPLNVSVVNSPAPSPVPTAVSTLPATATAWGYTVTGCSPIATPAPAAGSNTTVADQCNLHGHKIVDLEPGTTFSFSGLQTPLPTPSPTAPPNMLGTVSVPHAYVGSNLIEAMVQCLAAPLHADPVTATDTTIIAGSGTLRIYLCGSRQSASGTNTGYLEQSTSASCASGFTQIDDTFDFIANNGFVDHLQYAYYALPAGNSLCYHTTSTGQVRVTVYAVQF